MLLELDTKKESKWYQQDPVQLVDNYVKKERKDSISINIQKVGFID